MINNFDYSCIVIRMPQHKRLLYFYCYKECLLLTFNKIYVSNETPTNSCFRLAFQRQNTMLVYGIRCFVFGFILSVYTIGEVSDALWKRCLISNEFLVKLIYTLFCINFCLNRIYVNFYFIRAFYFVSKKLICSECFEKYNNSSNTFIKAIKYKPSTYQEVFWEVQ